MKKIGIVGGIGWQSTILYYAELCRLAEQRHRDRGLPGVPPVPEMSIESVDLGKVVTLLGADGDEASWAEFDCYHRTALQRVEAAGAGFALIACNTAHHRFAAISRGIGIPLINIFDAVAEEAARSGGGPVLILGTALTMNSAVFREAFSQRGIQAAAPREEAARKAVIDLIAALQSEVPAGADRQLVEIAQADRQFPVQPSVCLACTELPLAFAEQKTLPTFEHSGIRFLNTAAIHIHAAFRLAVEEAGPISAVV